MIVYGKQIFFYILNKHEKLIKEIYLAKECDKATFAKIAKKGFKIRKLDFKTAQSFSRGGNHQGFLLDIEDFKFCEFSEIKKSKFVVVLNEITDVGNIGAMLRTAYAFGIDSFVIIGKSLGIDGIIRTSSGAALDVNINLHQDVLSVINELKQQDFYLYASAKEGKDIRLVEFKDKKALILGSEGFGLSNKIIKKCDECVGIKMKNDFDSLNVSVAFGIFCDRMVK